MRSNCLAHRSSVDLEAPRKLADRGLLPIVRLPDLFDCFCVLLGLDPLRRTAFFS